MSKNKIPFSKFQVRWNDKVGRAECPYLTRWTLTLFGYSIRLHHWVASDDQRHFHDHPWWMLIIMLSGSYIDISPDKEDLLSAGSIRFREAEHRHTVKLVKDCWTLLLTGPPIRHWGFYIPGRDKLMRPLRYFSRFGHHQCDN